MNIFSRLFGTNKKRFSHSIAHLHFLIIISTLFVITNTIHSAYAIDSETFEFKIVQTNQSNSRLIPQSGWSFSSMPIKDFFEPQNEKTMGRKALWARFLLDAPIGDNQSLALLIGSSSERFDIYLNGKFIYKNYFDISDRNFANFEPHYVKLTNLNSKNNTIDIRLESDVFWTISLQNVKIGIDKNINIEYRERFLTSFQGPKNVNLILISATMFTITLWAIRRKEKILFWLSMVGLCWIVRNTRYYLVYSIIDPAVTWEFIANSTILLLLSFSAFGFHFFDVRKRQKLIIIAHSVAFFIIGTRYVLIFFGFSDLPSFLLTVPAFILIVTFFGFQTWRSPNIENISLFIALVISFITSYHDLAFLAGAWEGVGFSLFPYAGLAVFSAFSFALGRRLLGALAVEENLNSILENRVLAATAELSASEDARRELEVANAVTSERERMMREIHDGIGSNLVTALAVAERQQSNSATVSIIKSALTDLRIAVELIGADRGRYCYASGEPALQDGS